MAEAQRGQFSDSYTGSHINPAQSGSGRNKGNSNAAVVTFST